MTVPWEGFRRDLKNELSKVFVSRAPNRKAAGAAHKETINAIRTNGNSKVVTKRMPLEKVKLVDLEKMYDRERSWRLYELLRARVEEYGNKPELAFCDPVYMPSNRYLEKPNSVKPVRK